MQRGGCRICQTSLMTTASPGCQCPSSAKLCKYFFITLSVTSCCLTCHQLHARRSWQGRTDRTQMLQDIYVKLMMRKHLSDSLQKSSSEALHGASEATRCAGCFFPSHEVASFSCCGYIHSAVNTYKYKGLSKGSGIAYAISHWSVHLYGLDNI